MTGMDPFIGKTRTVTRMMTRRTRTLIQRTNGAVLDLDDAGIVDQANQARPGPPRVAEVDAARVARSLSD